MKAFLRTIRGFPSRWKASQATSRRTFALILGIFLLISVFSYWSVSQFAADQQHLNRSHHIISALNDAQIALNDVEDDARIFLTTKNTSLLTDFNAAVAQANAQFALLYDLTFTDRDQAQRLAALESLLNKRLTVLADLFNTRLDDIIPRQPSDLSIEGDIPDDMRVLFNTINDTEDTRLTQMEGRSSGLAENTFLAIFVSALSGVGLFLRIYLSLNKEISTRQQAVTALRESEQRVRTQFKGVPIPTYVWRKIRGDDDFILVDYNDSADRLTSGGVAKLLGQKINELYKDHPEMADVIRRCYTGQHPVHIELAYTFKTIKLISNMAVTCVFVKPDMVLVHTEDITERKHLAETLDAERNLLQVVIDTLPDYVHVKNTQSQFILGNMACALSLGAAAPADIVGKTDFDFHPVGMAAEFYADEQSIMRSGQPLLNKEEVVVDPRTNTSRWLLTTKVPLHASDGTISGLVGINRDITNRKTEEKTQLLLASIVASTDDAIIGMTVEGVILSWNKGAEKVYGYTADAAVGHHISMLAHVDHLSDIIQSLAKIRRRERIQQFETVHMRQDGSVIDVILTISPLEDSRGHVIGISTIAHDISKRKNAERELERYRSELETRIAQRTVELTTVNQQLRQEQRQMMRITDNMQDIICQIDLQGSIEYISPSCGAVLGRAPDALSGTSIFADVHPDDLAHMRDCIQRGDQVAYRYRHVDDHYLWLEAVSSLLVEPGATTRAIIVAMRDITARKQTEQVLQQSEERFRQLAENIDDMFWMSSPDYKNYLYVSPAYQKIWGRSCQSLYDRADSMLDAIYPDDVARITQSLQHPLAIGDDYDQEYRIIQPDGGLRWIHTRAFPIQNEHGEIYRLAGISTDITDQKLLEQELKDINRLKTEFLSTAAHELRTPLASLVGFSELLLTREVTADRRQHFMKIIHEQSLHLKEIIDTLLDISRLESEQALTIDRQPVDLAELVTKTQATFDAYLPPPEIQVEGLDSCPPVMGDKQRIAQVLDNLLSNALKYSPNGGVILIRGQYIPGFVQLSVQDHGIGMTAQQQNHLFERFYRADASNTTISGTGLGLAICKLIVEMHGGKIWIESEPGIGTITHFTLPVQAY